VSLRLLSYNIRFGGRGRERELASVIDSRAPDVVILQEATHPQVVERLAAACGMQEWGAAPGRSLAYLSRSAALDRTWRRTRFAKRDYLELDLAGLTIFGVHLSAIHSNLTERRRSYELQSLLRNIAGRRQGFHVVAGDFNTLAPGQRLELSRLPRRLRALSLIAGGRIRWRTIQHMLDAGYVDCYRELHPDDAGYTFPSHNPHVRLDYVFAPAPEIARVLQCEVVRGPEAAQASDHFPLFSEIAA
jgi:endonuclease/exonuclease/phosphatase family metal-dependent hydrolase